MPVRTRPAKTGGAFWLIAAILALVCGPTSFGQEARTGAIRGSIEDSSGRPLPQVSVSLRDTDDQILVTIQSDDKGLFEFQKLAAGRFSVTAWRAGYGRTAYGANEPGAPAQFIEISARQPVARIRLPMWKNASISGRVVDSAGDALVGVRVEAGRLEIRGGLRQLVTHRLSKTDDRGNYRLSDLAPGTYAAILPSPNTADAEIHYSTMYFPNVTSAESSVLIPLVREEERLGVDFVAGHARSFSVSGVIEDVPPNLRTPFRITLRQRGATSLGDLINLRTLPLDEQGRFKFDGVVPGTYVAEVIDARMDLSEEGTGTNMWMFPAAAGSFDRLTSIMQQSRLGNSVSSAARPLSDPPRMRWVRMNVTVEDRNVDGLIGRFQPGSTINGKVVFAGESPKPWQRLQSIHLRSQRRCRQRFQEWLPMEHSRLLASLPGSIRLPCLVVFRVGRLSLFLRTAGTCRRV